MDRGCLTYMALSFHFHPSHPHAVGNTSLLEVVIIKAGEKINYHHWSVHAHLFHTEIPSESSTFRAAPHTTAFLTHWQWASIPTIQPNSPQATAEMPSCQIHSQPSYSAINNHLLKNSPPRCTTQIQSFLSSYFSGCPLNSGFFFPDSCSNVDHPQGSLEPLF